MRYKRTLRVIYLILAAIAIFNPAWAGPPFVTDDPDPVEYQRWEVNYAAIGKWRQGASSLNLPSIDANYGIFPDTQLHVQPRYSYEGTTASGHFGVDDTEIGVKYRFLNIEQGNASFMLGVYPLLQIPTGDTRLGHDRGKDQSFLPLWAQLNDGKWTVFGGAGYRINPGAGNENSVYVGATALYQTTQSLQLGGEIFHETPNVAGGKSVTGFNLGGTCKLARDYNLLFSAGRGFDNVANQFSAYLALQVLY